MKKKILLIGYNYYPEYTGIGKYSGEMIYWLAKNGYECTVITGYPYYPHWKVNTEYNRKRFWYTKESHEFASGGRIKVHRCPMYIPSAPSGFKRMLLDFSFLFTASFKLIQLCFGKKIDLVVTICPSFLTGLLGIFYKKTRGAKAMYHVQDLQIEAARDLNMIKFKGIISLLFKIEGFILNNVDYVTTIGKGMAQKMQDKIEKDIFLLVNSVDTALLYPIGDNIRIKDEFGYRNSDKIILYSGAIGEKQGLESILYAANTLRDNSNLKFVICGSGPYKESLVKLSSDLKLTNVSFLPLQPLEKLNQFLNIADVHLVVQKSSASDLVMPSKLSSILAVGGLAIVTAKSGTDLHSIVNKNSIGLLIESESQDAMVNGILNAIERDNQRIRENARLYALNHLSINSVMSRFETFVA
ncbi:colanic acid biosynthesis fucosyltransferase WcaI [Larkinella ripae]